MERKNFIQNGFDLFKELTQPYESEPTAKAAEPKQETQEPPENAQARSTSSSGTGGWGTSQGPSSAGSYSSSSGSQGNYATAYATNSQTVPKQQEKDKVINISSATAVQPNVVVVKPEQYEELTDVADHVIERRIVFLNLEKTSKENSLRLLDFLNGAVYALDGTIKKVAVSSYLIVPSGVRVVDTFMDDLDGN